MQDLLLYPDGRGVLMDILFAVLLVCAPGYAWIAWYRLMMLTNRLSTVKVVTRMEGMKNSTQNCERTAGGDQGGSLRPRNRRRSKERERSSDTGHKA